MVRSITYPLRGLAGDDAQRTLEKALGSQPGLVAVRASASRFLLQVDYDDAVVTEKAIHDALRSAGIGHAANDQSTHGQ